MNSLFSPCIGDPTGPIWDPNGPVRDPNGPVGKGNPTGPVGDPTGPFELSLPLSVLDHYRMVLSTQTFKWKGWDHSVC